MDVFIKNVKEINDDINKLESDYIVNTKLVNKQILIYYLYRIFCKFINIIKLNVSDSKVNEILRVLKIPTNFEKCVPLVNKLPNDIDNINLLVNQLIDVFTEMTTNMSNLNAQGEKIRLKYLNELMDSKFDKIKIKEDLVLLSSLVPELSILESKPSERM